MLTGKCPKCGWDYYGWKLSFQRNQTCANCGTALEITSDDGKSFIGYSPFTAEKYNIELPNNVPPSVDKVEAKDKTEDSD